jgi:enamine deaminase RidA (YjgF/YER057c/UK114 family)
LDYTANLQKFRAVRNQLFAEKYYKDGATRPVSTALIVSGLFHPDWLVEIEATVVLPKKRRKN